MRLIRDYRANPDPQGILQEVQDYFMLSHQEKSSDLIVDGSLALEAQENRSSMPYFSLMIPTFKNFKS